METAFREILSAVGENLSRDGLVDTPKRAAKAMSFLTEGYTKSLDEVINGALFESNANEMVVVSEMRTSAMRGEFQRNQATRAEFLALLRR